MNTSSQKNYTEQELVAALQNREEQAMVVLYERYSKAMFNIIYRVVESQEMSEDVLQESFVKIWNNIEQYNAAKGTLFTWMLNICRNSATDKVRSKEFKAIAKNQSIENNVYVLQRSTEFNPETLGLTAMTEKLKPEQKEIVDLIYFNGYTHTEAAEELNLPLGTIKTRLRSAIMQLRIYFK